MTPGRPPFTAYARSLQAAIKGKVQERAGLKQHTTFRIGGFAGVMVWPTDAAELETAVARAVEMELPWRAIGAGSNLLVRDGGINEVVINTRGLGAGVEMDLEVLGPAEVEIEGNKREGSLVRIGAGMKLPLAVKHLQTLGLSGLEWAGGIPGSVGGAAIMNAGSLGGCMADVLRELTWFRPGHGVERVARESLDFSYRRLARPAEAVVVSVIVGLAREDPKLVREKIVKGLKWRRQRQPLSYPSAGSVFKNPEGDYAGRLIEASGLKGERRGDAQISEMHANFIVNRGRARSGEVEELIRLSRETVKKNFGVDLETEIEIIGEEIE